MAASLKDRLLAFAYDYLIILGYLFVLVGVGVFLQPVAQPLFTGSPFKAQLTGFCFITLPVTLYFALGESRGGTWGKRRQRLTVLGLDQAPPSLTRALARNLLKFVPWELNHLAMWHLNRPSPLPAALSTSLFYVVIALSTLYLVTALIKRTTPYDWLTGTQVTRKP